MLSYDWIITFTLTLGVIFRLDVKFIIWLDVNIGVIIRQDKHIIIRMKHYFIFVFPTVIHLQFIMHEKCPVGMHLQ